MKFGLVTQSKHVSRADLDMMARAIDSLGPKFSRAWATDGFLVSTYASLAAAKHAKAIPCAITDTPEDAEAYGFHTEENGQARVVDQVSVILDGGGGVLTGGAASAVSVLSVLAHEVFETAADFACNRWVEMPDGRFTCLEVCDPVQGSLLTMQVGGVDVVLANAVLPLYFDPSAPARPGGFDLAGKVGAAFELPAGGYRVVAKGGKVSEEWGEKPDPVHVAMAKRRGPKSRARRRGVVN